MKFILRSIFACTVCCNAWASAAESRRPNFVIIVADDQSAEDLRVYNPRSALQTPVLERLAAEGMVFDAAYHMGAFVGAVSRLRGTC